MQILLITDLCEFSGMPHISEEEIEGKRDSSVDWEEVLHSGDPG